MLATLATHSFSFMIMLHKRIESGSRVVCFCFAEPTHQHLIGRDICEFVFWLAVKCELFEMVSKVSTKERKERKGKTTADSLITNFGSGIFAALTDRSKQTQTLRIRIILLTPFLCSFFPYLLFCRYDTIGYDKLELSSHHINIVIANMKNKIIC